jgi:ABC-type phosphate/phosphonate transport system substrate-binding protein
VATAAPRNAAADGNVGVLVLKEHGIGSSAQAQPYVDKFVALAAKQNGWASAKAQFHTTRSGAETFVQAEKPHYGILSLAAFLGLKEKYKLDVIGQVAVARAGGQQYFLISKTASDLAGCKGKRLASDHADDAKFVDQVVAAGKFKLADFTLVATTRPLQGIKKVAGGEAECALVDDAQLAELAHLEGADGVRAVWSSEKLPAMTVVAFPGAPAAERKAFQASFGKLCEGDGKTACAEVGIQSFKTAADSDYAAVTAAYK